MLYRISNNRITRQPLTFYQKKVLKNLEDTAEKALAQYWDDVERSTLITTKERVVLAFAHFLCTNCNQEALLLQTDCMARYIKQNLVNCCTIVRTRSPTNPVWGQSAPACQISSKSVKRLRRYGDLTVFSKWRPSAILDLSGAYWDHPRRLLGGLYRWAKFGWNRCSTFDNMKVLIFCAFGLKTPIHAPKIGVFGGFDSLNGEQY